jgi:hypothetical protein
MVLDIHTDTAMPYRSPLTEALAAVRTARQAAADAEAQLSALRTAWDARPDVQATMQAHAAARTAVTEAETALRQQAVEAYRQTGDTHPARGVTIRVVQCLHYPTSAALAWAKRHDFALLLDRNAFEQVARNAPLSFVQRIDEPTATLSTDL